MLAKSLLVGALAAVAVAQQQVSKVLFFTKVPNPVTAGQPQAITYSTNESSTPATILLRKGLATDLKTIETLTKDATNGQFVWTPDTSLANGNDYALQIEQGTQVNYYGPFTLQGGSLGGSSSSSASGSSSTTTAMISTTKTGAHPPFATGNTTMTHSNTTMTHATKTTSTTSSIGSTMMPTGAGFQGTTAPAPTNTGAAATIATGSSAIAVIFGAVAAMLFY